jgi:hypothetical protein
LIDSHSNDAIISISKTEESEHRSKMMDVEGNGSEKREGKEKREKGQK